MTPQEYSNRKLEEEAMIERWRQSPEVATDMAIHAVCMAVDDLLKAAETREGTQTIRANIRMIWDAHTKLSDFIFITGATSMAAE